MRRTHGRANASRPVTRRWRSAAVTALGRARCVDGGTTGFESSHRHAERRTRDVVQPDCVEEVHGFGIAAMLAADTDLEVGAATSTLLGGDMHQPADAVCIDGLERRYPEDAQLDVATEERALDVVAGEPPAHLGQVVGAEREELRRLGDL